MSNNLILLDKTFYNTSKFKFFVTLYSIMISKHNLGLTHDWVWLNHIVFLSFLTTFLKFLLLHIRRLINNSNFFLFPLGYPVHASTLAIVQYYYLLYAYSSVYQDQPYVSVYDEPVLKNSFLFFFNFFFKRYFYHHLFRQLLDNTFCFY